MCSGGGMCVVVALSSTSPWLPQGLPLSHMPVVYAKFLPVPIFPSECQTFFTCQRERCRAPRAPHATEIGPTLHILGILGIPGIPGILFPWSCNMGESHLIECRVGGISKWTIWSLGFGLPVTNLVAAVATSRVELRATCCECG